MISSKDISVVVQGAIKRDITTKCLNSIRKYLPDAEIILSTWEGSDILGLIFDQSVLNQDPGPDDEKPVVDKPNNVNRQIVSTINGCHRANRKYILKLRTDCILKNANFLKIFEKFNSLNIERDKKYSYFNHRVLIESYFTRNVYSEILNLAYHPSDIWFFGLREDICDLFDIPMQKEFVYIKNGNYYEINVPEQYLFLSYLHKKGYKHSIEHVFDNNYFIQQESTKLMLNNFYIINHKASGIRFPKRLEKIKSRFWLLTTSEYFKLYKKFYSQTFQLPLMFKYDDNLEILKIKKSCYRLKTYIKPLLNLCMVPLLLLKILFMIVINFYKLFIRSKL